MRLNHKLLLILLAFLLACDKDDDNPGLLEVVQAFAGTTSISLDGPVTDDIPPDRSLTVIFSAPLNQSTAADAISLKNDVGATADIAVSYASEGKAAVIRPVGLLLPNSSYFIELSNTLRGAKGETFGGRNIEFRTAEGQLSIVSLTFDANDILSVLTPVNVPVSPTFEITFSSPLKPESIDPGDFALTGFGNATVAVTLSNDGRTVTLSPENRLSDLREYRIEISDEIEGINEESFVSFSKRFYTAPDAVTDFPEISDEELLTLVQEQTFKYFWDFGHLESGMARERNTSGDLVTSGGSGFGIMAIIVGIERNFITRQEGIDRMEKIVLFLESADRFHGAWSHWINGTSGDVVPFSANDNGGDLVETSFLVQGLITMRQYLDEALPAENDLIARINGLWESVEWNWYTKGGEDVLYWHWSTDKEWTMNHQIKGYNECLITYVLAASSTTYSIESDVYHKGWASDGDIANGKAFFGIGLPLGFDYGGPLFFSHYSFLGLNPRNLSDMYGNYWQQNVNHTLINHAYVVDNPKQFVGYSAKNWGLTASDNHQGYSAHSPTNDLGVITPTAAISSLPYTPDKSMDALRFFYYTLGDRLWGPYGFYDAFNITVNWTADSYLAIDQGPIIIMIENYRTGLLWDLFMSAPEVQAGLDKLGFEY